MNLLKKKVRIAKMEDLIASKKLGSGVLICGMCMAQ